MEETGEESTRADKGRIDEDHTVRHESTVAAEAAAAGAVVIGNEPRGVWERMSNDDDDDEDRQSDDRDDVTRTRRRQRQLAMMEEILRAAADEADDVEDWEQLFVAREDLLQLLEAGVLDDVEPVDVEARLTSLWLEVRETRRRAAADRRVPEQCDVCLEVAKLDRRPCCRLPVCRTCMTSYVTWRLELTGSVHIGCPNTDCDRFPNPLVPTNVNHELIFSAPSSTPTVYHPLPCKNSARFSSCQYRMLST